MTRTCDPEHALENTPFDRKLRRLRRDRAAGAPTTPHPLLIRVADDLDDRLDMVTRSFETALDLGCGPGLMSARLRARGLLVTATDAGHLFAAAAGAVQSDEDRLPFAPGSFDLAVSAGVLDTVNDLPGALVQLRRALRPDGLLLAAFPGAGSLPRLRRALAAADAADGRPPSPRLHPQIEVRAAGDLLARAGFALPVADSDVVAVRYPHLPALIADLRMLGWTNLLSARSRRPIGRIGLAAAIADFAAGADPDGRVTERFEMIHISGWAPAPSQPQPARRGSGRVSLADALRKRG